MKRFLLNLFLCSVAWAQVVPGAPSAPGLPTSTITGQIQTATGGTITGGTLSFTLSQAAVAVGNSAIVPQVAACYTSSAGNVVGLPDPLALPVVNTNIGVGSLPAATYYVKIYYLNANAQVSASSPELPVSLTSMGSIIVNPPTLQPSAASGWGIAISVASGLETVQSTVTGFTTQYTQSTALVAGSAAPGANTSSCNLWFSDSLVPTGTYYTVNLINANGAQVAGFPQSWCTYGGNFGTINVSQGAPTGSCNTNGVFYPTPLFSNPPAGELSQSVNSGLDVNGNLIVSGNISAAGFNAVGSVLTGVGSLNGIIHLDGVKYTSFAAAAAACPVSGTLIVDAPGTWPVSANLTIPSTCALRIEDGALVSPSAGVTLTISGPFDAPLTQVFTGSGTVTGLGTVKPEWFATSPAINAAVQHALNSNGGTVVLQPNTTYSSTFATSNGTCWSAPSNVWFQGGGQPVINGTATALTGGTIILGGMNFAGANGIRITNLGMDGGTAFYGGNSTSDPLSISGATGCTNSNPSDPLITGTFLSNVTSLLSGPSVAFHAIRLEHNDGCRVRNVESYFGTHGLTLKSIHCDVIGYRGHGQSNDAVIFKADTYTQSHDESLADFYADTLSSGATLTNGIIVDGENNVAINNITIDNGTILNAQSGLVLSSNSGSNGVAIQNLSVSHFSYLTTTAGLGLTQSVCMSSGGVNGQSVLNFHATGIDCINTIGGLNTIPMIFDMSLTNALFEGVHTVGADGTGSVFNGTNIGVNGWTADTQTESAPFVIGTNTNFNLTGYTGTTSLKTVGISSGGSLNTHTSLFSGGPFAVSSGIVYSLNIMTVTSLNSATVIPNTGQNAGILIVRDNTSGGTASFVIDPNAGATTIAGTVTGLANTGVTFSSNVWHITLTGGSTPRNLQWMILADN